MSAHRRLQVLIASALTLATVLWLGLPFPLRDLDPDVLIVGTVCLALLYGLAEAWPLTLEYRGETSAFTLNGVPLALGLVFLGPVPTLLARVLGTVVVLRLFRRQATIKLLVNLAGMTLEVWLAARVFALLAAEPVFMNSPQGWVAVGAAVVAADTVTGLVVLLAIRLSVGPLEGGLRGFVSGHAINFAIVIPLAVLSALVMSVDLRTVVLLAPFAVLLGRTNRQRHVLGERFASVERLYGFISDLSTSSNIEVVVHRILLQACAVSGATRAQLLILGSQVATIWWLEDAVLTGEDIAIDAAASFLHLADGGILLQPGGYIEPDHQLVLPAAYEQVLAGRFANAQLRGALIISDRAGNLALFDEGDVPLVVALAGHAGTALGSAHLLGRVQGEAIRRERLALIDEPTGLRNRNGLLDQRPRLPHGAVFLVGIRDLTSFSTGFGHEVAEAIAIEVGLRLEDAATPHGAIVARITRDQFAVTVDGAIDAVLGDGIARELVTAASGQIERGGLVLNVDVQVGVSLAPAHGTEMRELLRAADRALTEAQADRRVIGWFEFERDRETTRRLELASELREAIDKDQLTLAYQPKVDLQTGHVIGVEALARWPHATRGFVDPAEFIDIAERTGLIRPLTLWATRTAVEQASRWHAGGLPISLAINLSNATLDDVDVPWQIAAIIEEYEMPLGSVILEITESEKLLDSAGNGGSLSVLNAKGIPLSMDDFGTDYSSLAQMKALQVEELKIDRGFVTNLATDATDRAMCAAIITMGHELGMRVVAEGIEDADALRLLTAMGCDVGQGYYFARPVPAALLPTTVREIEAMTVEGNLRRLDRGRRL